MAFANIKDGQYTKTIYNLIKESRYAEAAQVLQAVSGARGRAALSLLGACHFHTQEYDKAAECYAQLAADFPHVADYRLYHAQALCEAAQYEEALQAAAQAAAAPELRVAATKLQAAARYGLGDAAAAHALVDALPPDDIDRDMHLGCLLYKDARYDEALAKFSRTLSVLGFDAHAHYAAALCYYRLKQYPQALKHLAILVERGVRDHPELAVGAQSTEGVEPKSVGNSPALRDTALAEAFNLKAAIEYRLGSPEGARDALADMPPRTEAELDAVTLHNVALANADEHPYDAIEKLNFLLRSGGDTCLPETFANLLLLYCKLELYELAADALAENAHLTYEFLTPYLYEFLDATISSQSAPEEAFGKYEELAAQQADKLRKLTRAVQEARTAGDAERARRAVLDYEEALERYVPVVMAQARVHWEAGDYAQVERTFRKSVEFCNESDVWRLNVAHVLFMQETKYKEAAGFYEPLVQKRYDDLLSVSAVVLANLCVSYIMTSQNEEAEDLMRRIEKEEERRAAEEPDSKCYHLCIVNLVIGTLYCAKGNFEFGLSRVIKSLEPFDKRLGIDTWHYAKRCFLALLENLSKHLLVIRDSVVSECLAFLDGCEAHGRRVITAPPSEGVSYSPALDPEASATKTVTYEARLLKYAFFKLRSIDDSVTINKFEDLK